MNNIKLRKYGYKAHLDLNETINEFTRVTQVAVKEFEIIKRGSIF